MPSARIVVIFVLLVACVYAKPHCDLQSFYFTYPIEPAQVRDGSQCLTSAGINGVCTRLENCDQSPGSRLVVPNDLCAYEINRALYCCSRTTEEVKPESQQLLKKQVLKQGRPQESRQPEQQPQTLKPESQQLLKEQFSKQGRPQESRQPEQQSQRLMEPPQKPDEPTGRPGGECITSTGKNGTCVTIASCTNRTNVTIKDLCYRDDTTSLFCCECCRNLDFLNHRTTRRKEKLRPIEEICEYFYPDFLQFYAPAYNGIPALPDEHPHMAAIGWTDSDGKISWECGGSVVTRNFILTAAHCTSYQGKPPDIARTGDLNLVLETEKYQRVENFNISEVFVHPDYNEESIYNDIALLKITTDAKFSDGGFTGNPACIWAYQKTPTILMEALGYGTDSFSGPKTNELFQVYLTVLPQKECIERIPAIPNYLSNGIIQKQLCAEARKHDMDTCQGDSGGPIQFRPYIKYTAVPMVVGITSFGLNCGGSSPGVYTRTSEYIDWLESILWPDFLDFRNRTKTRK